MSPLTQRERRLALFVGLTSAALLSTLWARPHWLAWAFEATPLHTTLAVVDPAAEVLILGASNVYRWPERSPDTYASTFGDSVANAAYPGWTTSVLLAALPIDTDARVIVLGDLGSPDLAKGATPTEAAQGVRDVVRGLLATTDAEIVVVALHPRDIRGADACAQIAETNARVADLLDGWDRVTWVDAAIPHDAAHFLADRQHLGPAGYRRLGEALAPVVGRRGDALIVAVTP